MAPRIQSEAARHAAEAALARQGRLPAAGPQSSASLQVAALNSATPRAPSSIVLPSTAPRDHLPPPALQVTQDVQNGDDSPAVRLFEDPA